MSVFSEAHLPLAQQSNGTGDVASAGTPGAGVPWFATAIAIPNRCSRVVLQITLSVGSIVSFKRNGGTAEALNGGVALTAGAVFGCVVAVNPGDTFNLQDSAGAAVQGLIVHGFHGGT